MNAKGKGMLKVVSILFIVFGAIAIIFSIIAVLGASVAAAFAGSSVAILMVAAILLLISSVAMLVIGIMGLKRCGDPSKAMFFIVTGIILCVLNLVSMILNFDWSSLIAFALPILYIVGGFLNKNSQADPVAAPPAE